MRLDSSRAVPPPATLPVPADPALPGLDRLACRLRPGRAFELVKHRPGRRMVIRERDLASGAAIYWKLWSSGRGSTVVGRHRELERLARTGRLRFTLPAVMGYWPDGRLLALAAASGEPIAHLAGAQRLSACAAAGRALASLHGSSWTPERTWTLRDEASVLARACGTLALADPVLGVRAAALRSAIVEGWLEEPGRIGSQEAPQPTAPARPLLPADDAPVPLHRDFHPGQVLVGPDGEVSVLDWDDAARGPAAVDVANFTAHLTLEALRDPADAGAWADARRVFLHAYFSAAAPAPWPWIPGFEANTLLRLAGVALERRGDLEEARALLHACAAALDGAA